MSLLLSVFDEAFTPRLDPHSLIYLSPTTDAPANQTNDKLVRSGLLFLLMPKGPLRRLVLWASEVRLSPG